MSLTDIKESLKNFSEGDFVQIETTNGEKYFGQLSKYDNCEGCNSVGESVCESCTLILMNGRTQGIQLSEIESIR